MSLMNSVKNLTDEIAERMEDDKFREALGDKGIADISKKLEAIGKDLEDPTLLSTAVTKTVSSFDDWELK